MLRYLTAGESHGRGLATILEGMPAGLAVDAEAINVELARRQTGYGRGGRMKIERDRIEILSGVRHGKTLGSPIGLLLFNRDWENWTEIMHVEARDETQESEKWAITRPRPGHADLSGTMKYLHEDMRNVLERASARETAMRVAVGAVCRILLREFGMRVIGHVVQIGDVWLDSRELRSRLTPEEIYERSNGSEVRCADPEAEERMIQAIKQGAQERDSLGGVFEVLVLDPPPGLGSHVHYDRKLDGRLAGALMSIQAMKGVEIGMGFEAAGLRGSQVHDEIFYNGAGERPGFFRKTNNAGGIEGGISNGEPLVVRVAMKPIPTLGKPLKSVDMATKEPFDAAKERSDFCSVPAASVVGEGVVAFEVAKAFLEKFGGDSIQEIRAHYDAYMQQVAEL